ncbi:MAG: DedA family protein [Hyphomicrobiales bacterium]|jgi:membrane protein YqaA with SNARE-associated domain|nr:MAG: DedA family protein [Hyphomicrobiales bacterium]
MLQNIYDWMIRTASHKNAPRALAAVSFAESSFFPIPPDIMLIPMILADRHKAWWYATIATIASVIGGIAGYAIGYFVFEYIGEPILRFYGYGAKFEEAKRLFNDWGVLILIAKGWTPFPFKILTISAGAFHMPLLPFVAASIVTRAMRFYLVAALLYFFGEPIRQFIETRLTLVTTAFVVLLVGGFVAARYVL